MSYPDQQQPCLYFGKYRGVPLTEVPTSYLAWVLGNVTKLSSGTRHQVSNEIARRGGKPPSPPATPPPVCPRCGPRTQPLFGWMEDAAGRKRITALCACGKHLMFMPHVEPYLGYADAAASPTAALDVLTACDDLGIELRSDGAAVHPGRGYEKMTPVLRLRLASCRHTLAKMIGKTTEERTYE